MTFTPEVRLIKSRDILSVLVKQKYMARGIRTAHRWALAGQFSLRKLRRVEAK